MKATTREIAQAAVESAYAMLKELGMEQEASRLAQDLRQEIAQRQDIVRATLATPSGDAGAFAESVRGMLEKKLGKPVELEQRADASLLGGALLEYGDMRIDFSLRGSLEDARRQMESSSLS